MGQFARQWDMAATEPRVTRPHFPPPPRAKVQLWRFMEPTLERLSPCPPTARGSQPCKPRPERHPKQNSPRPTPSTAPDFVDLDDGCSDDSEQSSPKPKKRSHAQIEEGFGVFWSPRQFADVPKKQNPVLSSRSDGGDRPRAIPTRSSPRSSRPSFSPPSQPLRVKPIQVRCPSPERAVILAHPPPAVPSWSALQR